MDINVHDPRLLVGLTYDDKREWMSIHRELARRIWETREVVPASKAIVSPFHGRTPRLAKLRKDLGFIQYDVGRLTGIHDKTISQYERGVKYPSMPTATRLAELFDCEPDDLYEPDESEHAA